jgi:hypothetical protein
VPFFVLRRRRLFSLLALAVVPFVAGCPTPPGSTRITVRTEQEDALGSVRDTVRKDRKLDGFRTAIAQLNNYLSRPSESKPATVTAAERELLAKQLHLTDDEIKEVIREDFSSLDAHYLEECFLFHDAIRALKLDWSQNSDAAQLERARLGFAWAMRQTWLRDKPARALPPGYALRVASTSAAERAGIALTVFRMLGLDAGAIGSAKDESSLRPWALGVRIGTEVFLFDPRAGESIPAAKRQSIATLRQARATPDLVKDQIVDTLGNVDVKSTAAESRVWLSPPLPSLAPRMRWLQSAMMLTPPIVLGTDLVTQSEGFTKAGEKAAWWNPPSDNSTPCRLLAHFVPTVEGGFDSAPAGQGYFDSFRRSLIPISQMPELLRSGIITGDPALRMNEMFARRFVDLQSSPGEPRDLILRGQYDDASSALVEQLGRCSTLQKRIATEKNLDEGAKKWAEDMRSALGRYLKLKNDRAPEVEVQAAMSRVQALEKESDKIGLLIERSAVEPHAAALTFLLAQCKHEQAERLSRTRREDVESIRDAWQNAAGWWRNFLDRFTNASWLQPAQIEHAKKMLAGVQGEIAKLPASK